VLSILGVIESLIDEETMSSKLFTPLSIDALNAVGFTSFINLTFFSELKKPKLGDLRSLNLNVLDESLSEVYGRLVARVACRSKSLLREVRIYAFV
jgi:hypothetical protein